jgi:hypothetical protein
MFLPLFSISVAILGLGLAGSMYSLLRLFRVEDVDQGPGAIRVFFAWGLVLHAGAIGAGVVFVLRYFGYIA